MDDGKNEAKVLRLRGPGGIKGTKYLSKTDDYSKETLQGHLRAFRAEDDAPAANDCDDEDDGDTVMHDDDEPKATPPTGRLTRTQSCL